MKNNQGHTQAVLQNTPYQNGNQAYQYQVYPNYQQQYNYPPPYNYPTQYNYPVPYSQLVQYNQPAQQNQTDQKQIMPPYSIPPFQQKMSSNDQTVLQKSYQELYHQSSVQKTVSLQVIQQKTVNIEFQQYTGGLKEQRTYTDKCCLILLAIIILFTICAGSLFINKGLCTLQDSLNQQNKQENNTQNSSFVIVDPVKDTTTSSSVSLQQILANTAGTIVEMMLLSWAFGAIFAGIIKCFPRNAIYVLIGFCFVVCALITLIGFLFNVIVIAIGMIFIMIATLVLMCCFRNYISLGIQIMRCASIFISQKPALYLVPLIETTIFVIFYVFWLLAWIGLWCLCTPEANLGYNTDIFENFIFVWYGIGIFFGLFLYYCMVFVIATVCGNWYYRIQQNSILMSVKNMRFHLGTFCFSAFLISLITVARTMAQISVISSGTQYCYLCLCCCLKSFQQFFRILNNNLIIIVSVTGKNFCGGLQLTMSLIYNNFGIFTIVECFNNFIRSFALFLISFVPALIGGYLIYKTESNKPQNMLLQVDSSAYLMYGILIIFILGIIPAATFSGVITQAMSCIFIFDALDAELMAIAKVETKIDTAIVGIMTTVKKQECVANMEIPPYLKNK